MQCNMDTAVVTLSKHIHTLSSCNKVHHAIMLSRQQHTSSTMHGVFEQFPVRLVLQ